MSTINYVRSASGTAQPTCPANSTHTQTVTADFASNAAGDTLFVVGYGLNGSIGSGDITSPDVTDTAGNVYTQIGFTSGTNTGSQTFVHALYWCPSCVASAGTNTVSFAVDSFNGNPIFGLAMNLAVSILELSGFVSPVIQDWATQTIVGAASPHVALTASNGEVVTSGFAATYTNSMFSVVDIYSRGADFLLAALSPSTASPGNPTVTGASWTYTLEENAVFGGTNYWLSLWIRGVPVTSGGLTDQTRRLYIGQGSAHRGNLQARQRGNWNYTLIVEEGDPYEPTLFSKVYFYDQTPDGFTCVFSGQIQSFKDRQIARDGYRYIDVTAVSLESIFDTVYVTVPTQYVNQTPEFIVQDLFDAFESGAPVTLGTIGVSGVTVPLFNANLGDKLSDLFTQLATTALFTWGVDVQSQELFFAAPTETDAPFVISSGGTMWDSIAHETDGSDYRNRQGVRLSFDAFPHSMEYFAGAGQQSFTLARPVNQVVAAYVTLSTPNTATCTFSGQPAAGGTVTIGPAAGAWQAGHVYALGGVIIVNGFAQKVTTAGTSAGSQPTFSTVTGQTTTDNTAIWTCQGAIGLGTGASTYTFVATLDNTQFGEVLIGASVAATVQNLADAINATAAARGATISLPTWENSQVNAISINATGFTVQQKAAGTGYVTSLTETSTNFVWSAAQTSGGTSPQGSVGPNEGATISIQVYAQGTSTAAPGLAYTQGSAVVTLATPLNSGTNLNIEYTRADGDVIEVENTALVTALAATSGGTGKYQQITDATSQGLVATNAAAGLQLAQQSLASYDVPPESIDIEILKPGIFPTQQLTIDLTGYWSLLNGAWYVEEMQAEFVPGLPWNTDHPWPDQSQAPGAGHYRYTLHLINVAQVGSYLDWWMGLGGGGGGSSAGLVATSGGAQSTGGGSSASSGGAVVKTANYAALSTDSGSLIVFNSGSPVTLTLPSFPPSARWSLEFQNQGAGLLTVSPNGLNLDGSASSLTVPTGAGGYVTTDAANYFTSRGRPSDANLTVADITTNNVSSAAHGFAPKNPNDASKYLDGTGAYSVPPGTGTGTVTHTGALTLNLPVLGNGAADVKIGTAIQLVPSTPSNAAQFLNGAATPAFAQVTDANLSVSDVTTNNVSTSAHGFAPKAPNDSTKFLDGTGAYSVPAGTTALYTVNPASVSGIYAIYYADQGCYVDLGVTLATAGQTIEQWNDQSGNNHHLTQVTAGKRPTYQTAGGPPGLTNRTVWSAGQCLQLASAAISTFTIFTIFRGVTPNGIVYEQSANAGSNPGCFLYTDIGSTIEVNRSSTISGRNAGGNWGIQREWYLVTHRYGGTHATHTFGTGPWLSQGLGTDGAFSNDPGSGTVTDTLNVGSRNNAASVAFTGDIVALVIFTPFISMTNIQGIVNFLLNKYNILG